MFEKFKSYFKDDVPAETAWEDRDEHSPENLTKAVNIFMTNFGLRIGPDFVNPVLLRAGLSQKEIDDMITATYNQALDNNMSVSANMAYLDGLRIKISQAIRDLDLAENV